MIKTLSVYDVANDLRSDSNANWSYEGSLALAEYLFRIEEESGQVLEFDHISVRCDYAEYDSALAAISEYWSLAVSDESYDEASALLALSEVTSVISFTGGVIIQNF